MLNFIIIEGSQILNHLLSATLQLKGIVAYNLQQGFHNSLVQPYHVRHRVTKSKNKINVGECGSQNSMKSFLYTFFLFFYFISHLKQSNNAILALHQLCFFVIFSPCQELRYEVGSCSFNDYY